MVVLVHRYIKPAFLQNRNIVKVVYVQPPKEGNCQNTTLWKLSTTICGLNDVSRSWDLNIKKELIGLGAIVCKSDPALFIWYYQSKVNDLLCTHVDDFLVGGTEFFLNKVINTIKRVFTIGSEHRAGFKYLVLNISRSNSEIIIDQVNYMKSVDHIIISNDKKIKR